jgi:predicted secreted protein
VISLTSEAVWAFGTELSKGGVAIAELTSINGLNLDSDEFEVTNHQSPGGYEEVIQTIRRTGVVTLGGNFIPGDAGQAALMTDYLAGTVSEYKITFPADMACEWTFDAYVKKPPSTEAPVDGAVPFTAELRVTGQPSLDISQSGNLTALAGIQENTGAALVFTPAFAAATYEYITPVNTLSTWVKFTVTGSDVLKVNGTTVTTTVQSGEFALGDAGTVTKFTITRKETGKVATKYIVHVARA